MSNATGTLAKMDKPVSVTFTSGDWDVVAGLLMGEIYRIKDIGHRRDYCENLRNMRRLIFQAQDKARA